MRRCLVAFVAVAALVLAGAAPARTIRVQWVDEQPLWGSKLVFRTTAIRIDGDNFAVATSVANRTRYAVRVMRRPPYLGGNFIGPLSFGIAWRQTDTPKTRHMFFVPAKTFSPRLPATLAPGATWRGTFSGRTRALRKHHDFWVAFGLFAAAPQKSLPPDPQGGYWLSDKTFRP